MRVSDLIPWREGRRNEPAPRDGRDPIVALQNDVNRAFDDFLSMLPMPVPGFRAVPLFGDDNSGFRVDIAQNEKELKIIAELPGIDEKDIDVRIGDGTLTISAEKTSEREIDENGYIMRERSAGRFERTLPLPEGLELDAAEASFKSGVLTVSIPRTQQAQGDIKHIPVRSH